MNKLNRQQLQAAGAALGQSPDKHAANAAAGAYPNDAPVTVLQIGEGNFLRGFFDWMVQESRKQGLFRGGVAVTQPRPSGKPKIDALNGQDRLYTLVIRGLDNGEPVERRELISVFAEAFDPYEDWQRLVRLAESPELRIVVSNTTEAGIAYRPEALTEGEPIVSYPGKIAYLLYRRYLAFGGAADRGLLFLPCELLDRNGDALKEAVLKYAADWGLPEAFREWVTTANRFLNSLVDRIVAGYPDQEQAEAWFAEWGYRDDLLCVAEPYHLWAIEGEPELDELLPFASAGLNVVWTDTLEPYRKRKVRILNGAHTLMTPLGILCGVEYVRELMEDETLGAFVRRTVGEEIIPTLPYPQDEMAAYANEVFDRYLNPFVRHRLSDIAMNSVSKFKVRLLPSLEHYALKGERAPDGLARGLAALLRYYRVRQEENEYRGTAFDGRSYAVRDDAEALATLAAAWDEAGRTRETPEETAGRLLACETLWGKDLSQWPGLAAQVAQVWAEWTKGERT
ncbi:tagaturonate reductase [Cohnella hongkongensis]|uniref:Tagaturonate reductase n=1 Tax=Cohnella hongkongensis TaxID=178337 RepID=A0ABV9FGV0_9BACL